MRAVHLVLLFLLMCTSNASADSSPADPATWYRDSYGSLWLNEAWNKMDEMATFYAAEIHTHEASEDVTTLEFTSWLAGPMEEWKADGWLSSQVSDLKVDRLNESTVSFKARWLDQYKDREDEYSCGWYLADLRNGQWKFTNYATISCEEHGLQK